MMGADRPVTVAGLGLGRGMVELYADSIAHPGSTRSSDEIIGGAIVISMS
jgi:hypothetical protein